MQRWRDYQTGLPTTRIDSFYRNTVNIHDAMNMPVPNTPRPFFGAATAYVPEGYVRDPFTSTYVQSPPATPLPNDARLDYSINPGRVVLPRPGETVVAGPVDTTAQSLFVTASPLTGVREFSPHLVAGERTAAGLEVDPRTSERLRFDLARTTDVPDRRGDPVEVEAGRRPIDLARTAEPIDASRDAQARAGSPLDPTVGAPPNFEQTTYSRLVLTPEQQSEAYADMRKRLKDYYADRLATDEEKHREFVRLLREIKQGRKDGPIAPTPTDSAAAPPSTAPTRLLPAEVAELGPEDFIRIARELVEKNRDKVVMAEPQRSAPVRIASLSAGLKPESLARAVGAAETLMKQERYGAALDQFDAAERLAPNNPLVWMGRAHAELAAGFFAKADGRIREAFGLDPTLMMAQFDLERMVGIKGLERIVKDLKEQAARQPGQSRPVFLLAYIAYHTGNLERAAEYLAEADRRAEGKDQTVRLVREHWNLGR